MGGRSDSDDEYRRSKKKKRRNSRSKSRSSDESYSSYSSKKSRKSKKKRRKRSRTRSRSADSRDRRYRRSRSPRLRSRSRSASRRSSRERYTSRRSRSRSWSRSRRRRSRSRSTSRRRSRSPKGRRSRSRSRNKGTKAEPDDKDPSRIVPGWDKMGPAEQAEARLQLALKAAANVDENLREQGLLGGVKRAESASNSPLLNFEERVNRSKAISDIESSGFAQATFKSSKSQRQQDSGDVNDAHDAAIFGGEVPMGAGGEMPILTFSSQPLKDKDTDSLMHPNLYVSAEEKMDRWIAKLKAFRRQKLEGVLLK